MPFITNRSSRSFLIVEVVRLYLAPVDECNELAVRDTRDNLIGSVVRSERGYIFTSKTDGSVHHCTTLEAVVSAVQDVNVKQE